jgi:hypothetical protein
MEPANHGLKSLKPLAQINLSSFQAVSVRYLAQWKTDSTNSAGNTLENGDCNKIKEERGGRNNLN